MTLHFSVAGGSPTWRRGIKATLEDFGYRVEAFESLGEWSPGIGGRAVVVSGGAEDAADSLSVHAREYPHIPAIAVVEGLSLTTFARLVRAGASTVVDELRDIESLSTVVEAAVEGKAVVPLAVLRSMALTVPSEEELADRLSDQELSWLRAMAEGRTVVELAETSGYSERAMFRMLRKLYIRLGVPNRTGALMWASRLGLVADSSQDAPDSVDG